MAANGDVWAVDKLLSRPSLNEEALPYWLAFLELSRDRHYDPVSMGMSGGVQLPRPISRDTLRREGRRLGYSDESLGDFVTALVRVDDAFVETETRRIAAEAKRSADRARPRR